MRKSQPLRIRLTKTHTVEEMVAMVEEIEANPDSIIGAVPPNMLNKAAMKRIDEITWAIYSKRGAQKVMPPAPDLQVKL